MLSVVRFEPRSVVAEHSHPHEQMGILLEGRLEFTVGNVTRAARASATSAHPRWRAPQRSRPRCARTRNRRIPSRSEKIICECPLSVVSGPLHRNADDRALCRASKLTGHAPGWCSQAPGPLAKGV